MKKKRVITEDQLRTGILRKLIQTEDSVSVAISHRELDDLSAFLTAFLTGVYYVVARLLEEHLDSRFGYLLGHKKAK